MNDANSLSGLTVALAESRELDLLARMVEERGGRVWRCPLVAIVDAPDEAAVQAWIGRMIAGEFDLFILFTGEGLRRLLAAAGRSQREAALIAALADTEILCRGPKPVRELRRLGLKPQHQASAPTTQGVIETLEQLDLHGRRVTLQLYGSDPNPPLIDHLAARGIDILSQFLIEAILISITGGLIGVILGCGASFVIKTVAHWPVFIQPWSVLLSFAVCTVTGVFFGWYPAKKAADLDPIEALRYE